MHHPDFARFKELASTGNVIPVYREYMADMDTPVSIVSRFDNDDNLFLLESVEGGERWGRYSFIGINPYAMFQVKEGIPTLTDNNGKVTELDASDGPLAALRQVMRQYKMVNLPELPPLCAGAIGYLGYETVNEFERLPKAKSSLPFPTSMLMLTDQIIIFDNVRHTMQLVVCAKPDDYDSLEDAYTAACRQIDAIDQKIKNSEAVRPGKIEIPVPELHSNIEQADFIKMVKRAKEYIVDGDIIQVVLSQRFSTELDIPTLQLYRALRLINPSPYTFYLKFGQMQLVGASPEILVRLQGDKVEVRPLAGTRRRGETEQIDRQLADELLQDEKERAEHLMLVDLGRNDVGRIAQPASVKVKDFMTIERYSHVMHLVSNVEAIRRPEVDAFDILKATFPAGTLSGAPKIRAMEIINELEPQSRGAYGGAVGYISYSGNMDMAITIRTLEINGNNVAVQAGAGIVYDSDPEKEYLETKHKAAGMVKALQLAANNLEL